MEALEQLALTTQVSLRAVLSACFRPLAWITLAAFVIPAAAAVALASFAHPLLSQLMMPVARALGGEAALHYPGMLATLPAQMERLGRLTDWVTVTLLLGWTGTVIAYGPRGVSVPAALFTALQRLPRLLLVGAPLVALHSLAVMLSAAALANLSHHLISAVAHLMAAFALESFVIGAGMLVLPILVRADLPLSESWGAFQRAIHWSTVAVIGFSLGLGALSLASRIAFWRAAQLIVTRSPDSVLFVVLAATLVTAIGLVAFATASVVLAAALDEGWE